MELAEALRKAEEFIGEAETKGYFLCSAFTTVKDKAINEWVLHFSGDKAFDCYVSDSVVVEESRSLGDSHLDINAVKISSAEALRIAGNRDAITILLSLRGSPPLWRVSFISAAFNASTVDIDARNGQIMKEETSSILKKD